MKEFLMRMVGLGLARLLLDWLLPDGEARQYADFGVGLAMTLYMLRALAGLLGGSM